MADDKKNSRILIVVAVIGLTGTLGAALIANWDKFFPPQTPSGHPADVDATTESRSLTPDENPGMRPSAPTGLTIAGVRRDAEKITAQWLESW